MSRHSSRTRRATVAAVCAVAAAVTSACATAQASETGPGVTVPIAGGVADVYPATLAVTARTGDGETLTLSAPAADPLGPPGPITRSGTGASWSYPQHGLTVWVSSVAGRLSVRMRSTRDQVLHWPVTATDPATTAIQVPQGDGLSIPVGDPFWNSPSTGLAGQTLSTVGDLTMPFWSTTDGRHGVSYLMPGTSGNQVEFGSAGGRLRPEGIHTFSAGENTRDWTSTFAITGPSPVAGALDYRSWLAQHGQLGSLRAKIASNPNVGRLLGAFHAYLWGSTRSAQGIQELHQLGISRLWLGYDADDNPLDKTATAAAEHDGYLVGPYDSWMDGQAPGSGDAVANWPAGVYPDFCVHQANGQPLPGFHGQGCYLSSQAFAQAEGAHHYLAQRTDGMVANGANSYFLDVDAAGQLFDDHTPAHPMNQAQDAANRLARMSYLSGRRGLVLGSESAGSWANQVLAFSHGSSTVPANGLWPLERDKTTWGGYYTLPGKDAAPPFFVKPVQLPNDLVTAMFDPAYRVPLYETALHDSVVSLDRWELSYYKLPNVETTRALLAMLYDTPLNVALDGPAIAAHGTQIAALQRYFAPLHEAAGTQPMTDFQWLTPDHQVQRTRFGNGVLTVTANFGTTTADGVAPGCVSATLRGDHQPRTLCPGSL